MNRKIVIIDSETGRHLRDASLGEEFRYFRANSREGIFQGRSFDKPVRMSATETACEYTGPGASHTPGRFLS